MEIKPAKRVESLPAYAFAVVDSMVEELKGRGIEPVDFGVGDPTIPTPREVRESCQSAIDARATSGYPSYIGDPGFREAVAWWSERRFGVDLDPDTEISSTIGSKEGIFNFHEAVIDPGDLVLVPSPGYPPYARGTRFAEGRCWFYPLLADNGFLPDLDAIPSAMAREAVLIWVNYPNSPTGVCPGLDFYEKLYAWTQRNEIILASDEAYSEYYFGEALPPTALQAGRDGVIVFNSLSKRSAMTGWRVGWVCGDSRIVEVYRKTKTNIDSGTPTFIQDAAATALADEAHVAEMREGYRRKRDILVGALTAAGLPRCEPEGTIYVWQRVPAGMTSLEFTAQLMQPETAVVCMPGSLIAEETDGGLNPGEGYVRFALTPELDAVERAAERIAGLSF